jgi:lipoate---protein ligase
MHHLDLTLPTPAENLAFDEALLLLAETGGDEALRFWQWPRHAAVLGAGGRLADDVDETACQADGVPILRRSSGGGTVLLGPGCLLFSLVLRFDRDSALSDLHASYRFILGRVARSLEPLVGPIDLQGISDLTLGVRKFSGNAQQRKRTHLLHHGTLLCGFDFAPIERYLKHPPRQPEYRLGRSHADFLTNLPTGPDAVMAALRSAWPADRAVPAWPTEVVRQLTAEKYAREEWIRRR